MVPSVLLKAAVLMLLLAIGAAIGASCTPERHQPIPAPAPQTRTPTAVQPDVTQHDIAGHRRNPARGITPGALEAEVSIAPAPTN